jgi:hypothetical protein
LAAVRPLPHESLALYTWTFLSLEIEKEVWIMANTATHITEPLLEEPARQPRREQRVASAFRVEVCGFNRFGRFFTERTFTANISDGGCQFSLQMEVEEKSVVALRVIERRNGHEMDSRPALFQVERIVRQAGRWTLGVSKLLPVPVWGVEFPLEGLLANVS